MLLFLFAQIFIEKNIFFSQKPLDKIEKVWYNIYTENENPNGHRETLKEPEKERTNMKYEARLKTSEWINDSGWDDENDEIESWAVKANQVDAWKTMIQNGDRSLFDYVTDSLDDEVSKDGERDIKYTMELVEIDEDDDTEEGKVIASTSVLLSELTTED